MSKRRFNCNCVICGDLCNYPGIDSGDKKLGRAFGRNVVCNDSFCMSEERKGPDHWKKEYENKHKQIRS